MFNEYLMQTEFNWTEWKQNKNNLWRLTDQEALNYFCYFYFYFIFFNAKKIEIKFLTNNKEQIL